MKPSHESLEQLLARLSAEMKRADPRAYAGFAPPAKEQALAALVAGFPGTKIPGELRRWFGWHDGGNADLPSFCPPAVWVTMSIDRSLSTRRFLLGPESDGARYSPDWLPLLENHGGDYLSYVMRGDERGYLVEHWHETRERALGRRTLHEFVELAVDAWANKRVRTRAAIERTAEWRRIPGDQLNATTLPVGSVVAFCQLSPGGRICWDLYVHVERDRWVWGFAADDPWEPDALSRAAKAMEGKDRTSTESMARSFDGKLQDIAYNLADPPPRAPADLGALGVYVATVRTTLRR